MKKKVYEKLKSALEATAAQKKGTYAVLIANKDGATMILNELRRTYPEAFNRPFHPFAGTGVESFLYGGEK